MIEPQFTTIRELQRNYKKVSSEVKKTNTPIIVLSKNKPQFIVISMDMYNDYIMRERKNSAKSLLELANWAENKKIKGPKDLSKNIDKYIWGDK